MTRASVIGLFVAFAVAISLAGCGGTKPYAEYFVVTFIQDTPTPAEEGVTALENAVGEARHTRPREITIVGAAPTDGPPPALADERAKAIAAEFTKAGIKDDTIHIEFHPALEPDFAQRRDSFIVTLAYGSDFPKP
ncbi:MAG TPA: hypothetical protein VLV50_11570 [Stellaceae bacterium]|nr:hypothetical protein [Stellaceae bacterium]